VSVLNPLIVLRVEVAIARVGRLARQLYRDDNSVADADFEGGMHCRSESSVINANVHAEGVGGADAENVQDLRVGSGDVAY
jgi:hypothetical protein